MDKNCNKSQKNQHKAKFAFALQVVIGILIVLFGPLAFFILIDIIDNPIITAIIGAILLMFITILAGFGKATGETFGANKATLVLKSLFQKNNYKNK
jgi:ABC-type multidrug transport system fused ATPase/permease subunit